MLRADCRELRCHSLSLLTETEFVFCTFCTMFHIETENLDWLKANPYEEFFFALCNNHSTHTTWGLYNVYFPQSKEYFSVFSIIVYHDSQSVKSRIWEIIKCFVRTNGEKHVRMPDGTEEMFRQSVSAPPPVEKINVQQRTGKKVPQVKLKHVQHQR